ncbi:MAG: hypothetical protein PUD07_01595 [bacterium]|nr:hypothetical protein [bacterium]
MIDKKKKIKSIIAIIILIVIVSTATFAYFGAFSANLTNNVSINISSSAPGDTTFTTSSAVLELNVPSESMFETNANDNEAVASNSAVLNVSLIGAQSNVSTICTYDIVFEYDTSSNVYGISPTTKTSGIDKEITFKVSSPSGTNHFQTEKNIDYNTSNGWTAATSTTGAKITLVSDATISIQKGLTKTQSYTVTARYYNLSAFQGQLAGKSFIGKIYVSNYDCSSKELILDYGYETILTQNGGREAIEAKGTPDFSTIATTNEGMYAYTEGSNKTYYFRGAVDNNWVKYGKFKEDFVVYRGYYSETTDTNTDVFFDGSNAYYIDYNSLSECNAGVDENLYGSTYNYNCNAITLAETGDDMYWRIIRIDGSNQIRMIYSGNTPPSESTSVVMTGAKTMMGMSAYNPENDHAEYVGFKYTSGSQRGTSTDSTIRTYLNSWYVKYFQDNTISEKVNTTFCNDRNTSSTWASTGSDVFYAAYERLYPTPPVPTFDCNTNDLFTENLGLITADEMVLAGAKYVELNANFYLNNEMAYWSASPAAFSGDVYMNILYPIYGLYINPVSFVFGGVRGVVTLSSNTKLSGSGTYDDVYVVVE